MKSVPLLFLFIPLYYSGYGQSCTLSVTIKPSNAVICSGNPVVLTADASNGTPAYTYSWSTGETTQLISVNKAGIYTVSVHDNTLGCPAVTQQITITKALIPDAPTAAGTSICPKNSALITATGPGGTYQWFDAATDGNLLGTNADFITPALTASTTYYVETNIAGCTSLRTPVTVNVTRNPVAQGASICFGTTATLTASRGETFEWYDAAAGGNRLSTAPNFTTPILTATTTYFVQTNVNGCTSGRIPVVVTVNTMPPAPTALEVTICSGYTATLSATSPGGTYQWYDVASGGSSLIISPDFTTPVLTATTTFYLETTLNGCISVRTPVKVTVNPIPAAPTASGATICSGSATTLSASSPGGTYQWFDTASGGTVLATGVSYTTPVLSSSTAYYVQTIIGGCASARTAVTVLVNPTLIAPSALGIITCSGTSVTLKATAPGGNYEWFDAASGGKLLISNASFTTPVLTNSTTYYVQTTISGCISPRTPVRVSIIQSLPAPAALTITICAGNTATLSASSPIGGSFEWYDAASGGNLLISNPFYITPVLSATTIYFVQTTVGGCTSARTPVTVTVDPIPAVPTVSGKSICLGSSANLTANTVTGILEWYDAASGGNLVATGANYNTPNLTANTTYYVQARVGQCSSTRTPALVSIILVDQPEFKYTSGTYCITSANQIPTIYTPSGGTFSSAPAGLVIDPNTGEIDLTASAIGAYTITFINNGPCPNISKAGMNVVFVTPDAQFSYNGPYCQKGTNPLPSFLAGASAGIFTASSADLKFINESTGEIDLNTSLAGTYTITNTISASGSCPGASATSTVTIDPIVAVNAGMDQILPAGSTTISLSGTTTAGSSLWSGGLGSFSNAALLNTTYTPGSGETKVTLRLSTNDPPGPCGAQSDDLILQINPIPAAPTAMPVSICTGNSAILTATDPGGNYAWYDAPSGGNLLETSAIFSTLPLSVTTNYYVQTTVAGISSARTEVRATVNPISSAPTALGINICSGGDATLTATAPGGAYRWYDASTAGNLLSTDPVFTIPALTISTTYYVETTINGCTTARTPVSVTVNPIPVITSVAIGTICSGTAQNYSITSNAAGATFNWSRALVPNISNAQTNQTSNIIDETLINTSGAAVNVRYIITPTANGCPGIPMNYIVRVDPTPMVTSAAAGSICNGTAHNYTIAFNTAGTSFDWSRAAVPGIINAAIDGQTSSPIREILINVSNTPLAVTYVFNSSTGGCSGPLFNYVLTVNPTAVVTSASTKIICSGESPNYDITSNIPSAIFSWSRAAIRHISNPAVTDQVSGNIDETLINTTSNTIINVYYVITPLINGCPGIPFIYQVTVRPKPELPVINSNSPVCIVNNLRLSTTTLPGASYLWTGPNSFVSDLQNPTIIGVSAANSGVYNLVVTLNGCSSDVASTTVSVNELPLANAGNNIMACKNAQAVILDGNVSGGTTTGIWTSSGTGSFSPSNNILKGSYIPSMADTNAGSVILTLTSTSNDDCDPSTSSMTITFQPLPIVLAGADQNLCTQNPNVSLNGQVQLVTVGGIWSTSGSGRFSPADTQLDAVYIPSNSDISRGSVTLTLSSTGNGFCNTVTDDLIAKFIPPPVLNAGEDRLVLRNKTIVLNPVSSNPDVKYLWTPNLFMDNNTVKNPIITGVADQLYTLTVTDIRGCVTSDEIFVKVLEPILIPSAFTPNGDGFNDLWNIAYLIKYPGATVSIFSRYGERLYYSEGYQQPWDGYHNGKIMPVGAYYYVIDTNFEGLVLSGYITILK